MPRFGASRAIRQSKRPSGGGAAVPVLGTLTLSGTLTNGTASSGTIIGATTASTITSNITGLAVNSGARTYSWDGTGAAGMTANGLVETLVGATGSPKNNSVTVAAAAAAISRLATSQFGLGHNTGTVATTSTGTLVTMAINVANLSGAPITVASVVFAGWGVGTTNTVNVGNDVPITGNIEYPSGTVVGTFSVTVPNGGSIKSADITLSASIPVGASFVVRPSCTITSGLKYGNTNLGFCGLVSATAAGVSRAQEALYVVGDSIQTNNGSALMTAIGSSRPVFQHSISGTRAAYYWSNFSTKHALLASLLGVSRFVSNFGTNDLSAGTSVATLQSYLTAMKNDALSIGGAAWTQSTITPLTGQLVVTATGATSSGNLITLSVPDASIFVSGMGYVIAGATPTYYNGNRVARTVNTTANTVTFDAPAGIASPATGTITITSAGKANTVEFQTIVWGPGSVRAQLNDWIRSGGLGPNYLEWADACEPSRDAGRWRIGGETSRLALPQNVTISSVVNAGRFLCNYTRGSSTLVQGFLMLTSGGNTGYNTAGVSNNNGDFTVAAPSVPWAVNDTLTCVPVAYGSATDDGLHPRVIAGGFGGQYLLTDATIAWFSPLNVVA